MIKFTVASVIAVGFANAVCEAPSDTHSDVDLYNGFSNILINETSEIDWSHPTATTNLEAKRPPGNWLDEQQLTVETFEEIVTTDVENVWLVAYIDPRCKECVTLSVEWEKLTQIEEKEKRKIKLGYVDVSVMENWKIIQDHTKGKTLTHTPAVTLYGDDKVKPYWYPKDAVTAEGVHTWVSNYADHYGYGFWDPDHYDGTGALSHHAHPGHPGQPGLPGPGTGKYGIGRGKGAYDSSRHNGAMANVGVAIGKGGKGYMLGGQWQKGDQVTQLNTTKNGLVLRRRSTAQGGKLSGVAHQLPRYEQEKQNNKKRQSIYQIYKNGKNESYDSYGNKFASTGKGTHGDAVTAYYGPGQAQLDHNMGIYEERWDPIKGRGIVVGKYTNTKVNKSENTDFDQLAYKDKDSEAYKDALQLVIDSGYGYSELSFDDAATSSFNDMQAAINPEDVPDISHAVDVNDFEIPEVGLPDSVFDFDGPADVPHLGADTVPDVDNVSQVLLNHYVPDVEQVTPAFVQGFKLGEIAESAPLGDIPDHDYKIASPDGTNLSDGSILGKKSYTHSNEMKKGYSTRLNELGSLLADNPTQGVVSKYNDWGMQDVLAHKDDQHELSNGLNDSNPLLTRSLGMLRYVTDKTRKPTYKPSKARKDHPHNSLQNAYNDIHAETSYNDLDDGQDSAYEAAHQYDHKSNDYNDVHAENFGGLTGLQAAYENAHNSEDQGYVHSAVTHHEDQAPFHLDHQSSNHDDQSQYPDHGDIYDYEQERLEHQNYEAINVHQAPEYESYDYQEEPVHQETYLEELLHTESSRHEQYQEPAQHEHVHHDLESQPQHYDHQSEFNNEQQYQDSFHHQPAPQESFHNEHVEESFHHEPAHLNQAHHEPHYHQSFHHEPSQQEPAHEVFHEANFGSPDTNPWATPVESHSFDNFEAEIQHKNFQTPDEPHQVHHHIDQTHSQPPQHLQAAPPAIPNFAKLTRHASTISLSDLVAQTQETQETHEPIQVKTKLHSSFQNLPKIESAHIPHLPTHVDHVTHVESANIFSEDQQTTYQDQGENGLNQAAHQVESQDQFAANLEQQLDSETILNPLPASEKTTTTQSESDVDSVALLNQAKSLLQLLRAGSD